MNDCSFEENTICCQCLPCAVILDVISSLVTFVQSFLLLH